MKTLLKRLLLPFILITTLSGCASTTNGQWAQNAAIADGITTQIALSSGIAKEMNPLFNPSPIGILTITAVKFGAAKWAEELQEPLRSQVNRGMSAIWGGAAINNVFVIMGAAASLPIVAGIAGGLFIWHESAKNPTATITPVATALVSDTQ